MAWEITFTAAKVTVLFTYPHQSREFADYERFIIRQFTTFIDPTQHDHVILLDKAISDDQMDEQICP